MVCPLVVRQGNRHRIEYFFNVSIGRTRRSRDRLRFQFDTDTCPSYAQTLCLGYTVRACKRFRPPATMSDGYLAKDRTVPDTRYRCFFLNFIAKPIRIVVVVVVCY